LKGFARVGLEKLASLTVLLNVQVFHQHLAGRADNISPPQGGSAGNQVDCFLNLVSGGGLSCGAFYLFAGNAASYSYAALGSGVSF
jgi:hypothetical protein